MSKTTKIIAALGVVAGLGVAALPAFTYATASVDGDAEVIVEVASAISLSIAGNNDEATGYGKFFESNPAGAYTDANGLNTNTSSSIVQTVPNKIIEGNETSGAEGEGFLSTLTVNTNDTGGYSLSVKAATSADVDLTSGSDTIPAIETAGSFTQGTAAWGIKTAADYSSSDQGAAAADIKNDKWYPVTTTNQTIRTAKTSATGYTNEVSKVYYGVSTGTAQPTGTYQATLTYTATTAN